MSARSAAAGEDEHPGVGVVRRGERRQEGGRSEQKVDRPDPHERGADHARRHAERDPLAQRRAREVEPELGGERGGIERHVAELRRGSSGKREHERRPDRVPGARHQDEGALRMEAATPPLPRTAGEQPGRDDQRRPARRQNEEHRDEHEHRRNAGARRDLELDARADGVPHDERGDQKQPGVAPAVGGPHGQRDGCDDEGDREQPADDPVAPRQPLGQPRARRRDQCIHRRVELDRPAR